MNLCSNELLILLRMLSMCHTSMSSRYLGFVLLLLVLLDSYAEMI